MKGLFQKIKNLNCEYGRKGIAIYFAVAALSIILAIALNMSALLAGRLKMMNQAGDAMIAFSAAQTGIEWALLSVESAGYESGEIDLGNGSTYELSSYLCGAASEFLCIESIGRYHNAQRAVKVRM